MAPQLSGALLAQGLAAAQAIGDERSRAEALTGLASQLSGEAQATVLAQGLEAVQAIGDEWYRAKALSRLAPQLSGELLAQGLEAAQAIGDEWSRAKALSGLAPHLSSMTQVKVVMSELEQRRHANRRDLLHLIGQDKLFNREKLGLSEETMVAISRSIVAICTEWRWL
ncbi:MAG: hypothetical protein H6631_12400 [Anaerolineaceae bacterium]|nr:hypothetical protein [Anaerolineaceae bacterium]